MKNATICNFSAACSNLADFTVIHKEVGKRPAFLRYACHACASKIGERSMDGRVIEAPDMENLYYRLEPLRANVLFVGDNGELTCQHCAGTSVRKTGRDLSGNRVGIVGPETIRQFGANRMSCEAGCTTVSAA